MRLSNIAPKKFSTKLIVMTLIAGLLPILTAVFTINIFINRFPAEISRIIDLGQKEQWQCGKTVLTKMAADFIRRKAMDVALQIELYLKAHPEMMLEALQNNPEFREIAIQPVGKTGYTVLIDSDTAISRFHNDPKMQNSDLRLLSRSLPEFWAIVEASLGGRYTHGFYQWKDPDGKRREKFMYIAPVGRKTMDGVWFGVAATTYIDEFTASIRVAQEISRGSARTLIGALTGRIQSFRNAGVLLSGLGVLFVLAFSFWVGSYFSRTIIQLRDATKAVNEGDFSIKLKPAMSGDVGELVEDFNEMVAKLAETTVKKEALEKSEERLKQANIRLKQEITGHKQAVDDLGKSEARYRAVFENTGAATIIVEEDMMIAMANREFEKLTGYAREELEGKMSWVDFVAGEDLERMKGYHDKRRETGGIAPTEYEFCLVDREGNVSDIFLQIGMIPGTKRSVASLLDITLLKRALREKDVLLAEVHHRVKNNMQIVASLLSLQSEEVIDERTLELFRNSEIRIKSIAAVHEKLYLSEDLSTVHVGEFIETIADHLYQTYDKDRDVIRIKVDSGDISFAIGTAIPLGLILNELISNAMKHAFPGGSEGEISVDLHSKDKDTYALTVKDNGIGFPEAMDFRSAKTFGLSLVKGLADQIDGVIEIKTEGTGASFEIIFKEQKYRKRI